MLAFLGIGAQKAGTTWLHSMLSQHPQLYLPEAKELHYWDKQYPHAPVQAYLDFFHRVGYLEGEITPSYALLPISTIQVIYQHLPDLKLIYSLRNPIERAWSAACMFLTKAQMELDEASDQWFLDHFHSKNSRLRGDYEHSIRQWTSIYPKENLLLVDYDLIKSQPKQVLTACCKHLGVADFTPDQLANLWVSAKVFAGQGYQLRPSLKQALIDLYTPPIQSLSQYLNRDFSHWIQH